MTGGRIAWVGGALVALVVLYLTVKVSPAWVVDESKLKPRESVVKAESDARGQLLQALGASVLLLGLYFTARTLRLNTETFKLNTQGQITERFTRAVDQLGNNDVDVRVGGLHALARIARDSPDDKPAIYEIFGTFVRNRARPRDTSNRRAATHTAVAGARSDRVTADVQAALGVLTEPGFHSRDAYFEQPLDLAGLDLRGVSLPGADLRLVELNGPILSGAFLRTAVFDRSDLRAVRLDQANLVMAEFDYADLRGAWLPGASLYKANFANTDLRGAHLDEAQQMDQLRSISGAWFDDDTTWPRNYSREQAVEDGAVPRNDAPGAYFAGPPLGRDRLTRLPESSS